MNTQNQAEPVKTKESYWGKPDTIHKRGNAVFVATPKNQEPLYVLAYEKQIEPTRFPIQEQVISNDEQPFS